MMKEYTLEEKVARAVSAIEIENVHAYHVYCHAAGRQEEEVEEIWSKRPDASWELGMGRYCSLESVKSAYCGEGHKSMYLPNYEQLKEVYPEVVGYDPRTLMEQSVHMLASSCMEIAEDGKSAKCIWHTPGVIFSTLNIEKKREFQWTWERYAADFILEDGQWKYLGLAAMCDYSGPADKAVWLSGERMGPPPMEDGAGDGEELPPMMVGHVDVPGPLHESYAPWLLPQIHPYIPEPYEKLEDTVRY
jgi:hypothetical protein